MVSELNGKTPVAVRVIGVEPRTLKVVHDTEPEQVTEVVATSVTPAAPFEYRRRPPVRAVVVARPVYVIVELLPPTTVPRVEGTVKGPETVKVEVATSVIPLVPFE